MESHAARVLFVRRGSLAPMSQQKIEINNRISKLHVSIIESFQIAENWMKQVIKDALKICSNMTISMHSYQEIKITPIKCFSVT